MYSVLLQPQLVGFQAILCKVHVTYDEILKLMLFDEILKPMLYDEILKLMLFELINFMYSPLLQPQLVGFQAILRKVHVHMMKS